ncbi:MAG: hypothetical protein J0I57_08680 [Hyphomicrobium sp.]|nr:hypothetical protein [Hyphomicrobium sp.]OJU26025.1 MAG: hypothetical protein BGN89_10990 [Alphaproteobacteria bacterium 64-6]
MQDVDTDSIVARIEELEWERGRIRSMRRSAVGSCTWIIERSKSISGYHETSARAFDPEPFDKEKDLRNRLSRIEAELTDLRSKLRATASV